MTQDEIVELAREAGLLVIGTADGGEAVYTWPAGITEEIETFAKLVAAKVEARYMQLFLDPENQPTQFGTTTQEYQEQEIAEIRDLLFALAHRIRTTHLYGLEVQKMLEQAEAIRARGET